MDDRIRAQALARGYVTRAEIVDAGYRDRDIKAAVRIGLLVRLRHGVYAYADDLAGLDELALHRLLSYAVVDRLGDGFVLSHQSACAAHGIESFGLSDPHVHVTRLDGRAGRHEAGVVHHVGHVPPDDVTLVDGRPVMVPARAVFELATIAPHRVGCGVGQLRAAPRSSPPLTSWKRWPVAWHGGRALVTPHSPSRLADGRCESVGESRSLVMMWRGGIPRPEQQVTISGPYGVIARVDFDWEAWRHTGEFDGLFKYGRLNPYSERPRNRPRRRKGARGRACAALVGACLAGPGRTCLCAALSSGCGSISSGRGASTAAGRTHHPARLTPHGKLPLCTACAPCGVAVCRDLLVNRGPGQCALARVPR